MTSWGLQAAASGLNAARQAMQARWRYYIRAADEAAALLDHQRTLLRDAAGVVQRARELASAGQRPDLAPADRQAAAREVDELCERMRAIAGSSFRGRPLFGGSYRDDPGVGFTWHRAADADQVLHRVAPDRVVAVDIDGTRTFGFGRDTDVLSLLGRVAADLRASDAAALRSTDLADLEARLTDIVGALALVSARTDEVDTARERSTSELYALLARRPLLEGADLDDAMMRLSQAEAGYQAMLAVSDRLVLASLGDFLR